MRSDDNSNLELKKPKQAKHCQISLQWSREDLDNHHNPVHRPVSTTSAVAEQDSLTLRQACSQENPGSAMCVQNFNGSRGFAIRITYRISLRSSSLWEPRHPLLKVVLDSPLLWSASHHTGHALSIQVIRSIPVSVVGGPAFHHQLLAPTVLPSRRDSLQHPNISKIMQYSMTLPDSFTSPNESFAEK